MIFAMRGGILSEVEWPLEGLFEWVRASTARVKTTVEKDDGGVEQGGCSGRRSKRKLSFCLMLQGLDLIFGLGIATV